MFSIICIWINGRENNREAGDLRRYRAHYDVIVVFGRNHSKRYVLKLMIIYIYIDLVAEQLCLSITFADWH